MKNFLFLIISFLIINSCGEDSVNLTNDANTTVTAGNKFLKQIRVSKYGTLPYYISYNYSGDKLVSIISGTNSFTYNLQYNGSQISVIDQTIQENSNMIIRKSILHYTNGNLTTINGTENSASGPSEFITTITYNGDKPSQIKKVYYENGLPFYTEIGDIEFSGVNISKFTSTFGYTTPFFSAITTYSNYDNKPNPLNKLPLAFNLSNSFKNKDPYAVVGLSSNNYQTTTSDNNTAENVACTYNTIGYLIKEVKQDVTLDYEYIDL